MTLKEIIDMADLIKPNTFSNEVKTQWVNECEGLVQTEVMLADIDDVRSYIWSDLSDRSVCFPDDHTIRFAEPSGYAEGGTIKISSLPSPYSANNWTPGRDAAPILAVSADGLTVTFADGTFAATGETFKTGKFGYDGAGSKMLVRAPHDKMYWVYLCAMIDFAFGEYTKYENTMTEFNQRLGEYIRWYALNYKPANSKVTYVN